MNTEQIVSGKRPVLDIPPRRLFRKEMGSTTEERAAWYRHMQATEPLCFHPEYNLWEVFRYRDVERVLLDYGTFSSEFVRIVGLPDIDDLGNTDPPRHQQLRGLVAKVFTPRSIAQLEPRITTLVEELLDKVVATGQMDVAEHLAFSLPVQIIAEMLGVPPQDQARFRRWSYQLMGALPNPDDPNYRELLNYFQEMVSNRAREPREDIISALLTAEANGEYLTRDEVISLSVTLLLAGHITTTMLINRGIYRFLQEPGVIETLSAQPELIPGAVEEVLRYEFSSANLLRLVRRDTILGDQQLKKGQVVIAWTAAANFDEAIFPDALRFDIRRSPNPHLTFGYGVHHCLGAPVGRLEGRIAFERILARLHDIRLNPDRSPRLMGPTNFIQSLPILFNSTKMTDHG
jgi:cytochrome P450 family 109